MKIKLMLSEAETETLLNLSINHGWRDARVRGAGMLRLGAGVHPDVIASELGISHQSIYNWRHAWEERGLVGLIGGHRGGRPPSLSEALIATAVAIASKEALTLKGIAQRLEAIHQCAFPCSLDTLGTALKAQGFSFKRTRWSLKKNATRTNLPPVQPNLPNSRSKPGKGNVN
jgi:transposase